MNDFQNGDSCHNHWGKYVVPWKSWLSKLYRIKSIVYEFRESFWITSATTLSKALTNKKRKQVSRLLQVNMEIYTKEAENLYMAKSAAYFTLHSTSAPPKMLRFLPIPFPSLSLVLITKARHVC